MVTGTKKWWNYNNSSPIRQLFPRREFNCLMMREWRCGVGNCSCLWHIISTELSEWGSLSLSYLLMMMMMMILWRKEIWRRKNDLKSDTITTKVCDECKKYHWQRLSDGKKFADDVDFLLSINDVTKFYTRVQCQQVVMMLEKIMVTGTVMYTIFCLLYCLQF